MREGFISGFLHIMWNRGNTTVLQYDDGQNDRVKLENRENDTPTIMINEATETDAGVYICKNSALKPIYTVDIIGKSELGSSIITSFGWVIHCFA